MMSPQVHTIPVMLVLRTAMTILLGSLFAVLFNGEASGQDHAKYFELRIIDRATQRGIPLVEAITVDDVRYVSDNTGRIAIPDGQLEGETVFFFIRSPGYQVVKDGFGIDGVRITFKTGGKQTIELDRTLPAERLYRITGRDRYRDTLLLGHPLPIPLTAAEDALGRGRVLGQDSVQMVEYKDQLRWFWGDTNRLSYPLGLYRTAGAVSPLPAQSRVPVSEGVDLRYFTRDDGFTRPMADVSSPDGVVWVDGLCTVRDGDELVMVAHFSRRRGLTEELEQGLLRYDDSKDAFVILKTAELSNTWQILRDHPIHVEADGMDYLMFGNPYPVTRVPARLSSIVDPAQYESFTCIEAGDSDQKHRPLRASDGTLDWQWRNAAPVTQLMEHHWVRTGIVQPDETRFLPVEIPAVSEGTDPSDHVLTNRIAMHSGTVQFNAFRNRWVLIAIRNGMITKTDSLLGEVYYSEAPTPQGPFSKALRIASHPGQSFYNPCHHPLFDEDNGRIIYFEGTYTNSFTSSPATPRYNYNQLMYRLNLAGSSIQAAFEP